MTFGRTARHALIVSTICAAASLAGWSISAGETRSGPPLKPVSSFEHLRDPAVRSVALFEEAGRVIQHARCVNCHPPGDRPAQGEDHRLHQPMVVRGEDGMGAIGMRCNSCHGQANFDPAGVRAGVPGHPQWHLAPVEMAWLGKTLGEICQQIKDPKRNGGKSMAELIHHMAEDSLVGWGWAPGKGREPAPGTQKEFGALIQAWADTGAACPKP
jgi:hypothetical protein